jgi:hypothetical protein
MKENIKKKQKNSVLTDLRECGEMAAMVGVVSGSLMLYPALDYLQDIKLDYDPKLLAAGTIVCATAFAVSFTLKSKYYKEVKKSNKEAYVKLLSYGVIKKLSMLTIPLTSVLVRNYQPTLITKETIRTAAPLLTAFLNYGFISAYAKQEIEQLESKIK